MAMRIGRPDLGAVFLRATFVLSAVGVFASSAEAVSFRVKMACSRDYYAYCSQFPSESAEVRQCMRAAGDKLSERCINALVDAGEVKKIEVSRRSAQLRR
jgi:hypothetical protein